MSGATPDEWARFIALGLTPDLLPVVSDTSIPISPRSRIGQLGKTPSTVNTEGHVVGIACWPERVSTAANVKAWAKDRRLGVCIQTRNVRALDVDINDTALSAEVRGLVEVLAGEMPCRSRPNSGKLLLAFRMPGEFSKRKIKLAGGQIEFLANGQQFIAAGTHTSGVRYQWSGPDDFPSLAPDEFEALWAALVEAYAVEADSGDRAATSHDDPVMGMTRKDIAACFDALDPNLPHDDWVKAGMAVHHETRGDGIDLWDAFSAKGADYPGRDSIEYRWSTFGRKASGPVVTGASLIKLAQDAAATSGKSLTLSVRGAASADEFEMIEPAAADAGMPAFHRDKGGRIESTVTNAVAALRHPQFTQTRVGKDRFKDTVMVAHNCVGAWRALRDTDYTEIRMRLEARGFKNPGRELIRDAVLKVADDNEFDSAIQWGESLRWDGVPRVDGCLARYFNTADTNYAKAVSRYLWTALAGRLLTPGEEVHMAVVLVGRQGSGKSRGVRLLAPEPDAYLEINLEHRDDNLARSLRGKLVGELGELRGLQSRDADSIKAWISRSHEEWTPKYMEFSTKFPRRLVLIGTTNNMDFLADETGERRWLPVEVGDTDLDALQLDRDQLWAEAIHLYRHGGVQWIDAQKLAVDEHTKFKVVDMWHEPIERWLSEPDDFDGGGAPRGSKPIKLNVLLQSAVGLQPSAQGVKEQKRAARVMKALGYEQRRATRTEGGKNVWVTAKKCTVDERANFDDIA